MTVHLDTSVLVDALTGPRRSLDTLIQLTDAGHRLAISAVVFSEWLRGPRTTADLDVQESLFPTENVVAFGPAEAALAAKLYKQVAKAAGREIDLAIAASALVNGASLLTLHVDDFRDVPGLKLVDA